MECVPHAATSWPLGVAVGHRAPRNEFVIRAKGSFPRLKFHVCRESLA